MNVETKIHLKNCPACGAAIQSFTAFCPYCGQEFEVPDDDDTDTVSEFSEELERLEAAIRQDKNTKDGGFRSWNIVLKILWIAFCAFMFFLAFAFCIADEPAAACIFAGIPAAIFCVMLVVRYNKAPVLTKLEQQKAALIRNYDVPVERKAMLELLMLIRDKIIFISKGSLTPKNLFWARLWHTKADLVIRKAKVVIPEDAILNSTEREIRESSSVLRKKEAVRAGIGAVILILLFVLFYIAGKQGGISRYGDRTKEWPDSKLASMVPVPEAPEYVISLNQLDYLSIYVPGFTPGQFEQYIAACKEAGFTVDGESSGSGYSGYTEDGYYLYLSCYDDEMYMNLRAPMEMGTITWPKSGLGALLPAPEELYGVLENENNDSFSVTLGHMNKSAFSDYADACISAGFDRDYYKSSDHFSGENAEGCRLYINYEGYDTVSVSIRKK